MYQARADAAPTRESELTELSRDYDTLQKLYASLLAKSEESKMSAILESAPDRRTVPRARSGAGPAAPVQSQPAAPVSAWARSSGSPSAWVSPSLLEYRDTSLKTDDDVLTALTIPVLAMVPIMMTKSDVRRRHRMRLAGGIAATLLVVAAVAAATWYLVWKA